MKVTYLQSVPQEDRTGQTVCFCDTVGGEYFILYGHEDWRVWTVRDNITYSHMIRDEYNAGWTRWGAGSFKFHSENTDKSRMFIWSEDQVLKAGVSLL